MILGGKLLAAASFLVFVMGIITVTALSCHPSEYEAEGRCCPKCDPGWRVESNCTESSWTRCVPCTAGTFMNKRNRQEKCDTCRSCDPGMKVQQPCTAWSDTVCEPMGGGDVPSNTTESGYAEAKPHTATTQPHRQSEEENQKPGEETSNQTGVIVGAVFGSLSLLLLLLAALVWLVPYLKKKICQEQDTQESLECPESGFFCRDGSVTILSENREGEEENPTENRTDPTTHTDDNPGSRDNGFSFRDESLELLDENPAEEENLILQQVNRTGPTTQESPGCRDSGVSSMDGP